MSSWCHYYAHNRPLIIRYAENGTLRIKKAVNVDHNKRVISDKTRELNDALQQLSVSRLVEYPGRL